MTSVLSSLGTALRTFSALPSQEAGPFRDAVIQSLMVLYTVMSLTWHYDFSLHFSSEGFSAIT